jgi:hypothetical protein
MVIPCEPSRVRLVVDGESLPVTALELTGQRAAIRVPHRVAPKTHVSLRLDWRGGACTVLPATVRAVAPSCCEHLTQVDFCGVEGAWEPFLAYVGPTTCNTSVASRIPARRVG